jgi:hypothetical protein
LRLFVAIPFILIGSLLSNLKIDDIGNIGNIIMNILGVGCLFLGVLIGRSKKEKIISSDKNDF